jgi:predicted secreted protein
MSNQSGTVVVFKVGSNVIAAGRAASFSGVANMIDQSSKSDGGWRKVKPGKKGFTMSVDGVVDYTDTSGQTAVADAIEDGSTITFTWGPATPSTGDMTFSGDVLPDSVEFAAPDNDSSTYSFSFQGTGAVTKTIAS